MLMTFLLVYADSLFHNVATVRNEKSVCSGNVLVENDYYIRLGLLGLFSLSGFIAWTFEKR